MTSKLHIEVPRLGDGIYSVSDIAQILGLPVHKVRHWFRAYIEDRLQMETKYKYTFGSESRFVNFYTLIEAYVFYQLRERGIKKPVILRAHKVLSELYNTPYPFARTEILTSAGDILFKPLHDRESLIKADPTLQYQIEIVMKPFSEKIEFGRGGVAEIFYPLGKEKSIVVSPHKQLGQPTIEGTNISPDTIYELYKAGESIEFITELYDLKPENIKDAIEFIEREKAA